MCNAGDLGSLHGLGKSPGEGKGYPLQYFGLENSMDWIVHGVAKSRTRLSDFPFLLFIFDHAGSSLREGLLSLWPAGPALSLCGARASLQWLLWPQGTGSRAPGRQLRLRHVDSAVAAPGSGARLSGCRVWACLLCGLWELPPGIKALSPALAGGFCPTWASQVAQLQRTHCQGGRHKRRGFDPWVGRSPGEGNGILQYSCLGNPVDRGSWPAAVHGVTKSQTRLSNRTHTHTHRRTGKGHSFHFWSVCCRKTSSFNQDLCQENQIKKRKKKKRTKKKKQTEGWSSG